MCCQSVLYHILWINLIVTMRARCPSATVFSATFVCAVRNKLAHRPFNPSVRLRKRGCDMLGTILLIILVLLLIGSVPNWGHSRGWGYGPSGGIGLVLVIVLILVLMGRV
jgi:Protein of unknown function (DUF3309)